MTHARFVAAIDNSAAAGPVVRAATALARLWDADVDIVHVREDGVDAVAGAADASGFPVRFLEGSPIPRLLRVLAEPDVRAMVVGLRGHPSGSRPAGSTAVALAEGASKPIVMVPPDWAGVDKPRRLLLPLDATEESAQAVDPTAQTCLADGMDLLVVHVFVGGTVPRFWDRADYAGQAWAQEFLYRYCGSPGVRAELRTGSAGAEVLDVAGGQDVDLIALAWSQDLSKGRAELVREVLAGSHVPVILVPVGRAAVGKQRGGVPRWAARAWTRHMRPRCWPSTGPTSFRRRSATGSSGAWRAS